MNRQPQEDDCTPFYCHLNVVKIGIVTKIGVGARIGIQIAICKIIEKSSTKFESLLCLGVWCSTSFI